MAYDESVDLFGEGLHALFQRVTLIRESKVGALIAACAGNAPGDRSVVRDTHDQAAFAAHKTRTFRHADPVLAD
jgi:hypothetical protein